MAHFGNPYDKQEMKKRFVDRLVSIVVTVPNTLKGKTGLI